MLLASNSITRSWFGMLRSRCGMCIIGRLASLARAKALAMLPMPIAHHHLNARGHKCPNHLSLLKARSWPSHASGTAGPPANGSPTCPLPPWLPAQMCWAALARNNGQQAAATVVTAIATATSTAIATACLHSQTQSTCVSRCPH